MTKVSYDYRTGTYEAKRGQECACSRHRADIVTWLTDRGVHRGMAELLVPSPKE